MEHSRVIEAVVAISEWHGLGTTKSFMTSSIRVGEIYDHEMHSNRKFSESYTHERTTVIHNLRLQVLYSSQSLMYVGRPLSFHIILNDHIAASILHLYILLATI